MKYRIKAKAAVIYEKNGAFSIEPVTLSPVKPDELLVKIHAAGVCRTDEGVRVGKTALRMPVVLGHEGAGTVEEAGCMAAGFKKGDRVVLSYGTCGCCPGCVSGRPYACREMVRINFGGRAADGEYVLENGRGEPLSSFFAQSSFATYAVVKASSAVKIEDTDVPFELLAPMGCGIQTGAGTVLEQLRPEFGSSLAVFGCGTVGMSAIMAARICGCRQIVAVGGNDASLALAKELGATDVINRKTVPDLKAAVQQVTGGGTDCAVETSGVPQMVRDALLSTTYTGKIAFCGNCDVTINVGSEMANRTAYGVSEGNAVPAIFIPKLISFYKKGLFPIDRLISVYPFEEINTAFDETFHGKAIKAVLKMKED